MLADQEKDLKDILLDAWKTLNCSFIFSRDILKSMTLWLLLSVMQQKQLFHLILLCILVCFLINELQRTCHCFRLI